MTGISLAFRKFQSPRAVRAGLGFLLPGEKPVKLHPGLTNDRTILSRRLNAMSSDAVNTIESTVRRERLSLGARIKRAFGPVVPGVILDLADLFSLTRTVGPWASFPIGFAIGVWLSLYYPFGWGWRFLIAMGSGLYTLTPGTEYIPLATILTCLGRFIEVAPEIPVATTDGSAIPDDVLSENVLDPVRRSPITPTRAACPECGSSSLSYGQVAQRFWPSGSGLWAKGHEVNAFVCLDCGFVGHYLSGADLEQLREDAS